MLLAWRQVQKAHNSVPYQKAPRSRHQSSSLFACSTEKARTCLHLMGMAFWDSGASLLNASGCSEMAAVVQPGQRPTTVTTRLPLLPG